MERDFCRITPGDLDYPPAKFIIKIVQEVEGGVEESRRSGREMRAIKKREDNKTLLEVISKHNFVASKGRCMAHILVLKQLLAIFSEQVLCNNASANGKRATCYGLFTHCCR